jgi:hypothetical protein
MRSTRKNYYLDLDRDSASLSFVFPSLRDSVYIDFEPSAAKWSTELFCDVCSDDSFNTVSWNDGLSSNVIDNADPDYYDKNDYVEEEPENPCESSKGCDGEEDESDKRPVRPKVVLITFKRRSNYKNIHYAM